MKTEKRISAGGVVFRRTADKHAPASPRLRHSRASLKRGVEVALISTKGGKVWGLPKGLAEKGENLAFTAHREVKEETGLDGRILKNLGHIEYFFTFYDDSEAKRSFKIVYFFLMEYSGGDVSGHDSEVDDCKWFPIDKAIRLMKYDDEKGILRKAKKEIKAMGEGVNE